MRGGVLIVDDYVYWQGAAPAVDEYLSENDVPLLLNRIDNNGTDRGQALSWSLSRTALHE